MKILAYKLKSNCLQYIMAANAISNGFHNLYHVYSGTFSEGSQYVSDFRNAGVLDLWFDPIYESFKTGDIVMVIDGGNGAKGADGMVGVIVPDSLSNNPITCGCGGTYEHSYVIRNERGDLWGLHETEYKLRLATEEERRNFTNKITKNLNKVEFSKLVFEFANKFVANTHTAYQQKNINDWIDENFK